MKSRTYSFILIGSYDIYVNACLPHEIQTEERRGKIKKENEKGSSRANLNAATET